MNIRQLMGMPENTPVLDAKHELIFRVSGADIKASAKGHRTLDKCVLAQALGQMCPLSAVPTGARTAIIYRTRKAFLLSMVRNKPVIIRYAMPKATERVVHLYDDYKFLTAFVLKLCPWPKSWSDEARRAYRKPKRKQTNPRAKRCAPSHRIVRNLSTAQAHV